MQDQYWFFSEISTMMYAMGDTRRPMSECVQLVEEVVLKQLGHVITRAQELANQRAGEKDPFPAEFGLPEILFVVRKDRSLLKRTIAHLRAKDAARLAVDANEEGRGTEVASLYAETKRMKAVRVALEEFDVTGELLSLLDENSMDEAKKNRLVRANMRASNVDLEEYTRLSEAAQMSFSTRHNSGKFHNWLFGSGSPHAETRPSGAALEILNFFAKEIVATLMDSALTIKKENSESSGGVIRLRGGGISGQINQHPSTIKNSSQHVSLLLARKIRAKNEGNEAKQHLQGIGIDALQSRSLQLEDMEEGIRRLSSLPKGHFLGKSVGEMWFCS